MTFEDIWNTFQLNPNELFKIEGFSDTYSFRPTGNDKEVKLFNMNNFTEPPATVAFYLMQNPQAVKKGRLFTQEEVIYAQLILDVTSDDQLSIRNIDGVYSLSNEKTISVDFPNIKNGESFLLTYILNNVYDKEGETYN